MPQEITNVYTKEDWQRMQGEKGIITGCDEYGIGLDIMTAADDEITLDEDEDDDDTWIHLGHGFRLRK